MVFNYRTEKTCEQLDKIQKLREEIIYKANLMVQKARYDLSITEQRVVSYAISQINPRDTAFTEYTLELNDLYDICCLKKESYTELKNIIKKLSDKSWWLTIEDHNHNGKSCESLVRWFNTLRVNRGTGKIIVKFHEDMFPFLLELHKRYEEYGDFYTNYKFKFVLPMTRRYSIRLYELLKSYSNNREWFFELDKLRHLLDSDTYQRYPDFRVRVLEPAIEEINKYTDILVGYEARKDGRKVSEIVFYIRKKDKIQEMYAHQAGLTKLEGDVHYWDFIKKEKVKL